MVWFSEVDIERLESALSEAVTKFDAYELNHTADGLHYCGSAIRSARDLVRMARRRDEEEHAFEAKIAEMEHDMAVEADRMAEAVRNM